MGTAEVESSLVGLKVGLGSCRGRLHQGPRHLRLCHIDRRRRTEALRKDLVAWVPKDIRPIPSLDLIQFPPAEDTLR
jgi:acetyl-CoA synthetase